MSSELFSFIKASPTAYHAVANVAGILSCAEYERLYEKDEWKLKSGGKYYVIREDSAIISFVLPTNAPKRLHATAAHSDSPCFKLKENPELGDGTYIKLDVEKYGGMIVSTWLDRPLSVAGRVITEQDGQLVTTLVDLEKPMAIIPNVAIHMDRDMNKGKEYNIQRDMTPLWGDVTDAGSLMELVAQNAGVEPKDILGSDLYLYTVQEPVFFGASSQYIASPRLDDLECVAGICIAMSDASADEDTIKMGVVFDNEEVGSMTIQGADGTFLTDTLDRIFEALDVSDSQRHQIIADSFMISADNAHAVHPNHPELADPNNKPVLGEGVALKFSANKKYTTDGYSAAYMRRLANKANISLQTFANRSDILGGSTLGDISGTHLSIPMADIGLPQLAMHSAVETAHEKDFSDLLALLGAFYS